MLNNSLSQAEERKQKKHIDDFGRFETRTTALVDRVQPALDIANLPFQERIVADGNSEHLTGAQIQRLEEIFNNVSTEQQKSTLTEIHSVYEERTSHSEFSRTIEAVSAVNTEAVELHNAKIHALNKRRLGTLCVTAHDLEQIEQQYSPEEAHRISEQLSLIRTEWYIYSGFIDIRLLTAYLQFGQENGLSVAQTINTYIDPVATSGQEHYYIAFAAQTKGNSIVTPEILAHIGLVHAIDGYPQNAGVQYDPALHLLHIDKVYLTQEEIVTEGMRILHQQPEDVVTDNILEIVRFVKNPYIKNSKNSLAPMLVMNRLFRDLQKINGNYIVCADLDKNIAGRSLASTGIKTAQSGTSRYSAYRNGLLAPRWKSDHFNIVDTSADTVACFFSSEDTKRLNANVFFRQITALANQSNVFLRMVAGVQLLTTGIKNMLQQDTSQLKVNAKRELRKTTTQTGPDELSTMGTEDLRVLIKQVMPEAVVLPLPAGYVIDLGKWIENPNWEIIKRVRALLDWSHRPEPISEPPDTGWVSIITPLGQWVNYKERTMLEYLQSDLARQGAYFDLHYQNLRRAMKNTTLAKLPLWFARYFVDPSIETKEISKIRSVVGVAEYATAVSKTLCIQAGLGTGGADLGLALLASFPTASLMFFDRGVIEPDNGGHQPWERSEIGASKLAAFAHRLLKEHYFAPWGSQSTEQPKALLINDFYSSKMDDRIFEAIKSSGAENIVLVDEIDVTDARAIEAKKQFHSLAIKIARLTGKPVTVSGGLDTGGNSTITYSHTYTGEDEPFYGLLNIKPGMEHYVERLSPFVLLAPLFTLLKDGIPADLEQILTEMAKKNSLEKVPQTKANAVGSALNVGAAVQDTALMQAVGMSAEEIRATRKRAVMANPTMDGLHKASQLRRYLERAPGNDGLQLLDYMLYLASLVYDTTHWPVGAKEKVGYWAAFHQDTARKVWDGIR